MPTEKYEIDITKLGRDEKIAKMNSLVKNQNCRAEYSNEFIHLSNKIFVKNGEWVEVEDKL